MNNVKTFFETSYLAGKETIGEAYIHAVRNSHLFFDDEKHLATLERRLRNYDDEELITNYLSNKEIAKLDEELL